MNPIYTKAANTVDQLFKKFGRTLTITRYSSTVNPTTEEVTESVLITGPIEAIVLPASKGTVEAFDNRREDGSLTGKQLHYIKIAAKGSPFEPKSLDIITMDGAAWEVLGCTPINPAGLPLVYGVGVFKR